MFIYFYTFSAKYKVSRKTLFCVCLHTYVFVWKYDFWQYYGT